MNIIILKKNAYYFKQIINPSKRLFIYGAGQFAKDINAVLRSYGYKLDSMIVDNQYGNSVNDSREDQVRIISIDEFLISYNPQEEIVIWGIASPQKMQQCINNNMFKECYLLWDICDFWKDKNYADLHKVDFEASCELLYDEYSRKVLWAYIGAVQGNIDEDIRYSTEGIYFNELTSQKRKGAFIDCGSFDGENAFGYMKFIGEECKIFAFEPDNNNYQNLLKRVEGNNNFICINKGCFSKEKNMPFTSNADMSSSIQDIGDTEIKVTTIDKVVANNKVAFIKMDVEGAELEALKGGSKTIARDMPILAISAYHKQEDLITLIPYINSLCNDKERYDIYLRHHGCVATELVIYAIPRKIG